MSRQIYYGLDEKPCSQEEAFRLFSDRQPDKSSQRQIGDDTFGDVRVSTVFLVIDHGFGSSEPILYETMIFGGKHDQYCRRYAHKDQAIIGHEETCLMIEGRWMKWLRKVASKLGM